MVDYVGSVAESVSSEGYTGDTNNKNEGFPGEDNRGNIGMEPSNLILFWNV